jgi:hypothetical protein
MIDTAIVTAIVSTDATAIHITIFRAVIIQESTRSGEPSRATSLEYPMQNFELVTVVGTHGKFGIIEREGV